MTKSPSPLPPFAPYAVSILLSATFVVLTLPYLDSLPHDFDEAWLILDARYIARGLRPYVDFAHHEMPLHLYLLALSGKVFGQSLFGYRMVSLASIASSGFVLFCILRPFVGTLPGLLAQVVFLTSPGQLRAALPAVPETPMVLFTLLGTAFLFLGHKRMSAYPSGVAFVVAVLIKPTCLVMILAAAASLAYAREWRRLRDLAIAGVVAALAGLAWATYASDGVFLEAVRFEVERLSGIKRYGMWAVDSGFAEMLRNAGLATPLEWALANLADVFRFRIAYVGAFLFAISLLAVPIWVLGCARSRRAVQAFAVLWPLSYLLLNFVGLDFVSPRYFVPFIALSAFLLAGWVWLAERHAPTLAVAAAGAVVAVILATHQLSTFENNRDLWYWGRLNWIAKEYSDVASFSPMLFAATGIEPGCGFYNPVLTYGGFGAGLLDSERTRQFRFTDERLVECLKAHPQMPMVIDWAFYLFTRPGSSLRAYLNEEGREQRLFFSPQALEQWDRPAFRMSPLR